MKSLTLCLLVGMAATACKPTPPPPPSAAAPVSAERPVISDGERAAATIAIQNLMSRHEFMHAANRNLEELDAFWVSRDGKYAATATFGSPAWVMYGIETIRKNYGEKSHNDAEDGLKQLAALDPSVKDVPENFGAGAEWVMHSSTTPLIEIAGDGKTAQGAWYSPGIGIMPTFQDGKIHLQPMMFNEKYGGDFVKEDGKWKIWHLQMAYDFVSGLPDEMVKQLNAQLGELALGHPLKAVGEAGERMGGQLPEGFRKPLYSYPGYSPQRPSVIWPKLPEPYYTFNESKYTNCNCEQEVPAAAP
ncbi:MAG: nuclear transport factor 2 family protein [Pseudomonas sp.]